MIQRAWRHLLTRDWFIGMTHPPLITGGVLRCHVERRFRSDPKFIAREPAGNRYGVGDTALDAVQDLDEVVAHYVETLVRNEGRMSPMMERHLAEYETYMHINRKALAA